MASPSDVQAPQVDGVTSDPQPEGSEYPPRRQSTYEEEEEIPQINVPSAIVLLIAVTVLVAFTAEFLVDSINGLVETTPLSQEWVRPDSHSPSDSF